MVPVGWYDFDTGAWIPSDNGRVIQILSIESGQAVLTVNSDLTEATDEELAELGITDEELQNLAFLYEAGKTLWRAPISHFSSWDCNWPWGPALGWGAAPG